MRDPAGLLQRMPELEAIARASDRVRLALGAGSVVGTHRALQRACRFQRLPKRLRDDGLALLADRRLFLVSLTEPPRVGLSRGIGSALWGDQDPDHDDETSITTQWLIAVIPFLPYRQLLIHRQRDHKVLLGQVPLGPAARSVQLALKGALLAALLVLGVYSGVYSRYQPIHLVNGLDAPVTVHLGDVTETVPALDWRRITIKDGAHDLVISQDGETLEARELAVSSRWDVMVLNLGGAAALQVQAWPSGQEPQPIRYAPLNCDRVQHYDGLTMVLPGHGRQDPDGELVDQRRRVLRLVGGWDTCLQDALNRDRSAEAMELLPLTPLASSPVVAADVSWQLDGPSAALHLLQTCATTECAYLRQDLQRALGTADPQSYDLDDPVQTALHWRSRPQAEALQPVLDAAVRWPRSAEVADEALRRLLIAGRYSDVTATYDRTLQWDGVGLAYAIEAHMALGNLDQAGRMAEGLDGHPAVKVAAFHATGRIEDSNQAFVDPAGVLMQSQVFGRPPDRRVLGKIDAPDLTIRALLPYDPQTAVVVAEDTTRTLLRPLPDQSAALLYAHARSQGRRELMGQLRETHPRAAWMLRAIDAGDVALLAELIPSERALLAYALSLQPELSDQRPALRQTAQTSDILRAPVTHALEND